jgi:processive 1,2-diacylglycerol beta-glucosyltransferase
MKKILILTTSTGQGHNQAANSLKEVFNSRGFDVETYDFLKSNSTFLNSTITKGYEFLASTIPDLYGFLYKITDKKYTNILLKYVFWNTEKKLYNYILYAKPDLIIGTHPLSVNIVTHLKRKNLINIPFISIITDFMVHYSYIDKYTDSYITANEYTKEYLYARGIDKDIIYPYGIPINPIFYDKDISILETKDSEYFNILLMGGSMGLDSISHVLKELIKNKNKLRITVICGNNTHLKSKLLSEYSSKSIPNKKLHILGFTKDVSSIMDYCDLVISKPGGLTVTESLAKQLPIMIPFAIPGQEVQNTSFLTKAGCALYVKNIRDINSNINLLIENPDILNSMKDNISKIKKPQSIENICSLSEKLIDNKNTRN